MELTSEEGPVPGCLVEKELTTKQLYPLTENALIAACNQTTNQDPVVSYDISTVRITVRGPREKGLLRMVHLLERLPGRKEARYGQLLVDVERAQARPLLGQSAPPDTPTLVGLAREVELLRGEVADLRTEIHRLREGAEED